MLKNSTKNETLNLSTTPNTEEKEVKMSKSPDDLSIEELKALIAKKEAASKREQLIKELEGVALVTIEDFLAVLGGTKTISGGSSKPAKARAPRGSKPPKVVKEWEISNGKPYFGGEEIKNIKKDNAGRLRIVKVGKGLPPEVAKVANEEVKALLMKLPVVK